MDLSSKSRGSYFTPEFFKFLRSLARNNNRVWFQKNKQGYERYVLAPSLRFIKDAGAELRTVSPYLVADPRPFWRLTLQDLPRHTLLQGQESLQDQCGHGVLAPSRRKEVLHRAIPSPCTGRQFCRCRHMAP